MSFQSAVGSFAQPTSTGTQNITSLSFTPQLVMFWISTNNTSDGSAAAVTYSTGAATASNQWWVGGGATNATTNFTSSQFYDVSHCIGVYSSAGSTVSIASLSSLNSNGFSLSWTTVDSTARIINFVAIGGITNAYASYFEHPSTTGNFAVTGIGFQPDIVLTMGMGTTTVPPTSSGVAQFKYGLGAFNSTQAGSTVASLAEGSDTSWNIQRALPVATVYSVGTADPAIPSGPAGAQNAASFVSMDSSGFTLDYSIYVTSSNRYSFYVALKGLKSAIGTITQPSSTGNQTVSGLSFKPGLVFLHSANKASSTATNSAADLSIGACDGSLNQFATWYGLSSGSTTVGSSCNIDRSNAFKMLTESGASPTLNAVANLNALSSSGFTLDFTTTNATGAELYYIALAGLSNNYTNTQTASMGKFGGAPVKKTEKAPSAHMSSMAGKATKAIAAKSTASLSTFSGKLKRLTGLPLTGATQTFAGVVGRQAGKAVKGFKSLFNGSLVKGIDKSVNAQMSPASGNVTKGTSMPTTGSMATFSGTTARTTGRALTAATKRFNATLTRKTSKVIDGAMNLFNAVVAHARPIFISASMAFFKPDVTKQLEKPIKATPRHFHGTLQRVISHGFVAKMAAFVGVTGRATTKRIAPIMASFKAKVKKSTSIPLSGAMALFHGFQVYGQSFTVMLSASMNTMGATFRRGISKETATKLNLQPKLQRTITKSAFDAIMNLMSAKTVRNFAITISSPVINFTGKTTKQTNKALDSSIQFSGFIGRARAILLTATQSFKAAIARNTSTTKSASLPKFSVKVQKQTGKTLPASLSFTGTVTKKIKARLRAAMQTFSGKVVNGRLAVVNIVASMSTMGGSVVRYAHKAIKPKFHLSPTLTKATTLTPFESPLTFDANTTKRTSRAWTSAAIGFTAKTSRSTFKKFKTSIGFVAAITKNTFRPIVGTVTFNAQITKRVNSAISATLATFTHSFSRFTSVAFKTHLKFSPALTKAISQHPLTANIHTFGAKLKKQTSILAQAAMNPFSAIYGRAKAKSFSASMNTLGARVVRQTDKQVTAKLSFAGALGRKIPYLISGAMSAMSARLARHTAKTLAASTQPMSASVVRHIGKAIRSAWTTFKSTFGLSSFVLPKYRTIHAPYRRSIIVARRQQTVVAPNRKYIIQAK